MDILSASPVSVLLCTYHKDSPEWLRLSLESLYSQTVVPDEIVIVVDGDVSTCIKATIDQFVKKNIPVKVVWLEENIGLAKALNVGIRHCKHELIVRMDADDINLPDRIESNLELLGEYPQAAIVGGAYLIYDQEMAELKGERRVPLSYEEATRYARYRVPFNHPTILFKKSKILSVGGYPENLGRFEDWGLSLRCLVNGLAIANTPKPLLKFRGGGELMSRRSGLKYCLEELTALVRMWRSGLMTDGVFCLNIFLRLPFRMLPRPLVATVYKFIMHRKVSRVARVEVLLESVTSVASKIVVDDLNKAVSSAIADEVIEPVKSRKN